MNIINVKQTIEAHFPNLWLPTEACLSTMATLFLKQNSNPTALVLIGQASAGKTTTLDFISGIEGLTYRSDHFTPKSFVSHYATESTNAISKVDLMPRIKDKCFIIADLGIIFAKRREDLTSSLSVLTRVMDGDGLVTDSGVWGQRGNTGEHLFCMCCATTPIGYRGWEVMGRLGSRLLFLSMKSVRNDNDGLIKDFVGDISYKEKREICKVSVHGFIKDLLAITGIRKMEWNDREIPLEVMRMIANLSQLLAKLRGIIPQVYIEHEIEYQRPLIEAPHRGMALLLNIGKGRAITYNRKQIGFEDLHLLAEIVLSSCPEDRGSVFRKILKKENFSLSTSEVRGILNVSENTALRLMNDLNILGLVEYVTEDGKRVGRPERMIRVHPDLVWITKPEARELFSKIDGVV